MPAVLISGGSRGIGAACVKRFSQEGWRVAFTYCRSKEDAEQQMRECPGTIALYCDMEDPDSIRLTAETVQMQLGPLQALVCNAGMAQQKMFCDLTAEDWQHMLQTNLLGAAKLIQTVLPQMVHRKDGSIVTVASMWGMCGASCESHYAASKAALIGLSKSLAQELGPSNIRVNCVAPGVIATDMNSMHSKETMQILAEQACLRRNGKPDEVAQAVFFLASQQASYINGQILSVTGGFE